ncbi:MAG: NADP-dependent isocitrate dehydrogenase, partial [Pseudomonadota bacterium]
KKRLSTKEFTEEVISRLGKKPLKFSPVKYSNVKEENNKRVYEIDTSEDKILVGVDIVINWNKTRPTILADEIMKLVEKSELGLQMISVKGLKSWPDVGDIEVNSDEYCLRFAPRSQDKTISHSVIVSLLNNLNEAGFDFVRTNNLYIFGNDKLGFSLIQGE